MTITDSVKGILTIGIKPRTDSYTDQYTRIFMTKLMSAGSLIVGLNWYTDKITCIQPGALGLSEVFVGQACWMNGLYIYRDLRYRNDQVAYYGMPRDIRMDGMYDDGTLCATQDTSLRQNKSCNPMTKTFYLEFQFICFYFAILGLIYYLPYALHRCVNTDIQSLKGSIADISVLKPSNVNILIIGLLIIVSIFFTMTTIECNPDAIVKNYFNYRINPRNKLRARAFGQILIKALYLIINIMVFVVTDVILDGNYRRYGLLWIAWYKQPNEIMYDYVGEREGPKPGNYLLPAFGFCSLQEASQDIKFLITNKHKLVCEMSQYILYQYVFFLFWICMVFGIVVSAVGFILTVSNYSITFFTLMNSGTKARRLCTRLTLRESEYLEFIRRKNLVLYGAVLYRLRALKDGHKLEDIC